MLRVFDLEQGTWRRFNWQLKRRVQLQYILTWLNTYSNNVKYKLSKIQLYFSFGSFLWVFMRLFMNNNKLTEKIAKSFNKFYMHCLLPSSLCSSQGLSLVITKTIMAIAIRNQPNLKFAIENAPLTISNIHSPYTTTVYLSSP